jgi:hypothetical protein
MVVVVVVVVVVPPSSCLAQLRAAAAPLGVRVVLYQGCCTRKWWMHPTQHTALCCHPIGVSCLPGSVTNCC